MKGWRGLVAVVFVAGLAMAPAARADFAEDAGWGALTVLANVGYMPVKMVYGALGGLTGGLAYGLTGGDFATAETVWVTSLGGTYVLTPRMLQGEDEIAFTGSTEPAQAGASKTETASAPPAPALEEQQLGSR